jgi:hypothetical protein
MDDIPNLGTIEDRKMRLTMQRLDSSERQALVSSARKKLYEEGYAVDGETVGGLLKDESLVPTEVKVHVTVTSYSRRFQLERLFVSSGQVWPRRLQDAHG